MKSKSRLAALILLPTTLFAIAFAPSLSFFENSAEILGVTHPWREWMALGPLALFFFVAGLELKAEFTTGLFVHKRSALIPLGAVTGGMLFPALLYLLFARIGGATPNGWGIPMATDLPLVLAALSFMPVAFINKARPFLLALAITDDLGSIIVLAVRFHQHFSAIYLSASVVLLLLYWAVARGIPANWKYAPMVLLAIALWICSLKSGISPTVFAVVLALLTPTVKEEIRSNRWEPTVNFIVIPLFIISVLAIKIDFSFASIFSSLSLSLIFARLIGKPLGIFCGAWIAARLTKSDIGLSQKELIGCGVIASLGLSVSLLFAQLSLDVADQALAILGTIITVPLALGVIGIYYFLTRDTAA